MNDKWIYISYTMYCASVLAATVGWAGYGVFVAGHSGWWMLGAVLMCSCEYKPHQWRGLVDGIYRKPTPEDLEE